MPLVSVIIPNLNGLVFLPCVLDSLKRQTFQDFEVILVDNGSKDGSLSYVYASQPQVKVVPLDRNHGFARAVNEGIRESSAPYVLLLNNDTEVREDFVEEMVRAMERHPQAFAGAARMMQFAKRDLLDDAGNFYCALGWAFARGKGKKASRYAKEERVFASCAGAAIYRRDLFEKVGLFDEKHFAYLEDVDICYRARLLGYESWYFPSAVVYHVGSGTSGSRHNAFKVTCSSRNSIYLVYKNMPLWQILLNAPLLLAGTLIKLGFFCGKGLGRAYLEGLWQGVTSLGALNRARMGFWPCLKIQGELWVNLFRILS